MPVTLADLVDRLPALEDDAVICVRRPWSEQAEARLCQLNEKLSVPADVKSAGFDYFLEASVAKEVIGVFVAIESRRDTRSPASFCTMQRMTLIRNWVYEGRLGRAESDQRKFLRPC